MQTETMPIDAVHRSSQTAELYLHTVEDLSSQLESAMAAIVARSLPAFQESVGRQQASCAQLSALPRYLGAPSLPEQSGSEHGLDADLIVRIAAATDTLRTLNQRYSALLGHTGDTMRLFERLFGNYYIPVPARSAGTSANLSTWSCEV